MINNKYMILEKVTKEERWDKIEKEFLDGLNVYFTDLNDSINISKR